MLFTEARMACDAGAWCKPLPSVAGWVGEDRSFEATRLSIESAVRESSCKQARMERFKTFVLMRMTVAAVLVLCVSSGCGLIMVGDPVQKQDISAQNDAEENLKAIRAILDEQAARRGERQTPPGTAPPPSASSSASTPSATPSDGQPLPVEPFPARPTPSPSSAAAPSDVPAKLPWTPSAPLRPAVPDRQIPAYTTPAPVGPDYSGTIRCAPDGMGGQRCLGR